MYRAQGTSPPAPLAHSYTPIVQLGHLLVSIKGDVQGLPKARTQRTDTEDGRRGRTQGTGRVKRGRQSRRNAEEANSGSSPQGQTLSLSLALSYSPSRSPPLATLVTPTTSTLVQDNRRLIPPLVFYLAPTHLGRDTHRQIYWSVQGPPRSETPIVGAPGRGLLRVNKHFPVGFQMGRLQQPLQPGTVLRFGSLEFMSLDGSYDIVLLPPQHDSNYDGRRPSARPATANSTTSSP